MARDENAPDEEDPAVVDLTQAGEVDWLVAARRKRICRYETGIVVETPDGEGAIDARFVQDLSVDGREISASRESPTYTVKLSESEPPHPSYDEADLTEKDR